MARAAASQVDRKDRPRPDTPRPGVRQARTFRLIYSGECTREKLRVTTQSWSEDEADSQSPGAVFPAAPPPHKKPMSNRWLKAPAPSSCTSRRPAVLAEPPSNVLRRDHVKAHTPRRGSYTASTNLKTAHLTTKLGQHKPKPDSPLIVTKNSRWTFPHTPRTDAALDKLVKSEKQVASVRFRHSAQSLRALN